jgi:hypothetical protein
MKKQHFPLSTTQRKMKNEGNKTRRKLLKVRLSELDGVAKEKERLLLEKQELEERVIQLERDNMEQKQQLAQLELDNMKQRQQLAQLELDNVDLKQQVTSLEEEVEKLVDKIQTTEKIVHNTSSLISQLPFNSPFHRPLLSFFLDGLSFSDAKKLYSISKRTYGRIVEDDGETLVGQRYAIGVTRTRISDEQKQEIARILDDILQVQTGRNWSYQEVTDKKLYELYFCMVNLCPKFTSFIVFWQN